MKQTISVVLNLCLGLFIASGAVSFVDDSLRLLWGLHLLTVISGIVSGIAFLSGVLVYILMGLTPVIPKRVFLPVTLFYAAGFLASFPALIFGGGDWVRRGLELDWVISLCQVVFGLGIFYWLRGEWKFRWALVPDKFLGRRNFSWLNLSVFALVNIFVALPAVIIYFIFCAALAVSHFTDGFLTVRPGGLTSHVKQYARSDGKQIELVPMAHVGDAGFYRKLSESFPTNSIVLMEGVSDEKNLLTNGISYKRMARSLGLSEQVEEFKPQAELVRADVDVDQFSTNTINLLNFAMLFHAKGVNVGTLLTLALYTPPANFEDQLFDDLLNKRNQHLLGMLRTELPKSDLIIVPWGAGHMPEIAKGIEKEGFHLTGSKDYTVIRF
ncbi:MAG TPA: hypothetical protein VGJ73_14435 [Verrucomicrobiae bacterium]|jgi:hypothetical protein